jgi:hypothetical protein
VALAHSHDGQYKFYNHRIVISEQFFPCLGATPHDTTFSMKTMFPNLEQEQKRQRINFVIFALLAVIFGGAFVYLGILIFDTP